MEKILWTTYRFSPSYTKVGKSALILPLCNGLQILKYQVYYKSYLHVVPDTVGVMFNIHVSEGQCDCLGFRSGHNPETLDVVSVSIGVIGRNHNSCFIIKITAACLAVCYRNQEKDC